MAEAKQIDLYRAIEEMKEISARGGTFSLRFRKWNRETGNFFYRHRHGPRPELLAVPYHGI